MPQPVAIARHFVTIGGERQVHYRRAGSGPPVLLLHQSPRSSREFLPLIAELADEYTVIAPDTPGNGLSDPLPPEARMADYADAVVEFMDAIGLERALVYGFHTGAACALELAGRHAARMVAGVANGYTQLNPAELEDILARFLPPFVADWTGGHLLWAWARIREQYVHFPWYRQSAEARLATGLPRVEQIHEAVMDLLRAGDHYRYAYRAAFAYDRCAALREVRAPLLIMTAQTDALHRYLERMPQPPPSVRVARPADYAAAKALLRETFADAVSCTHLVSTTLPPPAPPRPLSGRLWSDLLPVQDGWLRALRSAEGRGPPVVMCHDTAGSCLTLAPALRALLGKRPLLAVDLPGNGESDPLLNREITVADQASLLEAVIAAAGYETIDVLAHGGGAVVAAELALRGAVHVRCVAIWETPGPPLQSLSEAQLLRLAGATAPAEYGTHLIEVWHQVRDQFLFAPRHAHRRENVRAAPAWQMQAEAIHARTLDALACLGIAPSLYRAHAAYPLRQNLARLACPLRRIDCDLEAGAAASAALAFFDGVR